jgi:hypothetical protein
MVLKQRKMQAINSSKTTAAKVTTVAKKPVTKLGIRKKTGTNQPGKSKKSTSPPDDDKVVDDDNEKQPATITARMKTQATKKRSNIKRDKLHATSTTPKATNTKKASKHQRMINELEAIPTTSTNGNKNQADTSLARAKPDDCSPRNSVATNGSSTPSDEGKAAIENKELGSSNSNVESLEEAACCLCHCGVDCSDRALFFPKDRKQELEEDEDYYFSMEDPYLDTTVYDRNNSLVYCDTCGRLYHQKCHFVPLLVIPRGDWNCLICTIQQQSKQQGKPPTSNRKRKKSGGQTVVVDPSATFLEKTSWRMFLNGKVTDQLFQSPPRVGDSEFTTAITGSVSNATLPSTKSFQEVQALQKEWELAAGAAKAFLWHQQLRQLKTFLNSQASNIRMANAALTTLTSTKRNRQHFSNKAAKSQELAQTIVRLTSAKFKIRDALVSLESIRTRDESVSFSCLVPWCQVHPQHAAHVFPFGVKLWQERRIVPRTRERMGAEEATGSNKYTVKNSAACKGGNGAVPSEINLQSPLSPSGKKTSSSVSGKNGTVRLNTFKAVSNNAKLKQKERDKKMACRIALPKKKNYDDDNDSGITLDDLKCSVCMIGDCTDENDVILCDGQGCHRAFHMKCVYPAVKLKDIEDEDENWFCPICLGLSKLMGEMHDLCVSSEGVGDDDDECSDASWENVQEIFPESEWEYETAIKLSKGKRNEETQRLLAMFLGEDIVDQTPQMPIGSDSEDENDYSLFDEESYEQKRKKLREEEADIDDTICSSDVTLVDLSSVEYKVGKAELAALSEDENVSVEDSDKESDTDRETGRIRKSRRLSKRIQLEEGESRSIEFGADFSEANILEGKRKRKIVDYRKLNDALFGGLTRKEQVLMDDADDFVAKVTKQNPDAGSDVGSELGSDDENSASSSEHGDDESNEDTSESPGGNDKSEDETSKEAEDDSDSKQSDESHGGHNDENEGDDNDDGSGD